MNPTSVARPLAAVLALLTIFGPISMDLYLPVLPALTDELGVATSALCALSPSIEMLIAARFVQGLAGAVGIVIAQAAGRDVYSRRRLIRYYGRLTVLGGLAAIVGPVIGGQLAKVTDWRGVFLFLAGLGIVTVAASVLAVIADAALLSRRRAAVGALAFQGRPDLGELL